MRGIRNIKPTLVTKYIQVSNVLYAVSKKITVMGVYVSESKTIQ